MATFRQYSFNINLNIDDFQNYVINSDETFDTVYNYLTVEALPGDSNFVHYYQQISNNVDINSSYDYLVNSLNLNEYIANFDEIFTKLKKFILKRSYWHFTDPETITDPLRNINPLYMIIDKDFLIRLIVLIAIKKFNTDENRINLNESLRETEEYISQDIINIISNILPKIQNTNENNSNSTNLIDQIIEVFEADFETEDKNIIKSIEANDYEILDYDNNEYNGYTEHTNSLRAAWFKDTNMENDDLYFIYPLFVKDVIFGNIEGTPVSDELIKVFRKIELLLLFNDIMLSQTQQGYNINAFTPPGTPPVDILNNPQPGPLPVIIPPRRGAPSQELPVPRAPPPPIDQSSQGEERDIQIMNLIRGNNINSFTPDTPPLNNSNRILMRDQDQESGAAAPNNERDVIVYDMDGGSQNNTNNVNNSIQTIQLPKSIDGIIQFNITNPEFSNEEEPSICA